MGQPTGSYDLINMRPGSAPSGVPKQALTGWNPKPPHEPPLFITDGEGDTVMQASPTEMEYSAGLPWPSRPLQSGEACGPQISDVPGYPLDSMGNSELMDLDNPVQNSGSQEIALPSSRLAISRSPVAIQSYSHSAPAVAALSCIPQILSPSSGILPLQRVTFQDPLNVDVIKRNISGLEQRLAELGLPAFGPSMNVIAAAHSIHNPPRALVPWIDVGPSEAHGVEETGQVIGLNMEPHLQSSSDEAEVEGRARGRKKPRTSSSEMVPRQARTQRRPTATSGASSAGPSRAQSTAESVMSVSSSTGGGGSSYAQATEGEVVVRSWRGELQKFLQANKQDYSVEDMRTLSKTLVAIEEAADSLSFEQVKATKLGMVVKKLSELKRADIPFEDKHNLVGRATLLKDLWTGRFRDAVSARASTG